MLYRVHIDLTLVELYSDRQVLHVEGGGVAHWVIRLTGNVEIVGSSPIKGTRCFIEQETVPLLLSTGWFQEQTRA